jgi:thioredoxin-related protein
MKQLRFSLILSLLLGLQHFASAEGSKWLTNYDKALAQAKAEKKMVLMNFTGSDWCPVCEIVDKQVLNTKEFKEFAAKNLVLLEVDFPESKPQADEVRRQNEGLRKKFSQEGFPTFIVTDADGKELWRQEGYLGDGPAPFIAKIAGLAKS